MWGRETTEILKNRESGDEEPRNGGMKVWELKVWFRLENRLVERHQKSNSIRNVIVMKGYNCYSDRRRTQKG